MATTATDQLVPLGQVAARCRIPPQLIEAKVAAAGIEVQIAWDGRPCIRSSDAADLVDAEDRARQERERLEASFRKYAKAHRQARSAAYQEAFAREHEAARRDLVASIRASGTELLSGLPSGGPQGHRRAREAGTAAVRDFDAKHPLLDFHQWARKERR